MTGFSSLKRIIEKIFDLSYLTPEDAKEKYSDFPEVAEKIASDFVYVAQSTKNAEDVKFVASVFLDEVVENVI
ncbi:MAG: hypothetical protein ACP5KV_07485, partial [Candidatus Methanomethylicaceae archaeon]